jgi:EpsI family protein
MLILIAIGLRFADPGPPQVRPQPASRRAARPEFVVLASFLVLVGAALGPAYAAFLEAPGARPDLTEASAPPVAAPWQKVADTDDSWRPMLVGPDREIRDAWTAEGRRVQRVVALYAVAGRHNNLVRSQNRIADEEHWVRADDGRVHADIGGRDGVLNSATITQGGRRRLVWYAYVVDGHVTASALDAKLRQARAILVGGRSVSAFVALSADASTDAGGAAATLRAFAAAMSLPSGRPQ